MKGLMVGVSYICSDRMMTDGKWWEPFMDMDNGADVAAHFFRYVQKKPEGCWRKGNVH
ncbi:MAG: hypothetical protein PHZ03_07155 [Syntrophomonas sp.]|nr:hypothetical protein [Syntrophomonas sp.]